MKGFRVKFSAFVTFHGRLVLINPYFHAEDLLFIPFGKFNKLQAGRYFNIKGGAFVFGAFEPYCPLVPFYDGLNDRHA